MKIEKNVEKILDRFSKTLESVPELEETWYITDNLNLSRKDEAHQKDPERIRRNAKLDKDGNVIVKKADWIN
ncbi:MAG: Asp-tRNA(Asn) amidotransferase subunit GatC [Methanobacteriaceae archaeon]|jgi:aspartyl-tRNA(Asn)/glutamyl-tRNA(Gln) amidotransferase subunit C|nr:Asp-tRNA(Asn) amidotransferase subunit GatC [Methanobacteriaceae archaeon]